MIVAVVGLGYVGCPLLRRCLDVGLPLVGIDIDTNRIQDLSSGINKISTLDVSCFTDYIKNGKLKLSSTYTVLKEVEAVIICLPTPLTKQRTPDLSYIESSVKSIAENASKGVLVMLESTTYPGTTIEVILPVLEKAFGKVGVDFYLGYSPEREDPGNPLSNFDNVPKVISGVTEECKKRAIALYSKFVKTLVPVSSCSTAEMIKIWENTFRIINISAVNELKMICDRMSIDIWEVIDAAKTKPYGFTPFYPGPGIGGHCIPVDPFYLTWKAKEYEIHTRFIELAGEINFKIHSYVVEKVVFALNQQQKSAKGSKVLIFGLAYKANICDLRESPAFPIIERLQHLGIEVDYHDPFVPEIPNSQHFQNLCGKKCVNLSPDIIGTYDVCLMLTLHKNVPYEMIAQNAKSIVDTRNCMGNYKTNCAVTKA